MKKYLLTFLLIMSFAMPANAYNVTHKCSVFLGLFNATSATFTYSITPISYAIKSNIKTSGVFGSIYPFTAEYKTTGNIEKDLFKTTSYISHSKSRFNTRSKEMFYNKDGKPTYRISNKNNSGNKKTEILPPPDNVHSTDLQTVFAEIITQYQKTGFCNARLHVFDGKKSFDTVFNDEGKETIPANEFSPYFGEAVKCSFYADDLGQNLDDLIFEATPDNPFYIWILKDKKTNLPFIAKMEKPSTVLGKLVIYTNQVIIEE